jgi:hypothetical protein
MPFPTIWRLQIFKRFPAQRQPWELAPLTFTNFLYAPVLIYKLGYHTDSLFTFPGASNLMFNCNVVNI